jgi:hypothetical protein
MHERQCLLILTLLFVIHCLLAALYGFLRILFLPSSTEASLSFQSPYITELLPGAFDWTGDQLQYWPLTVLRDSSIR